MRRALRKRRVFDFVPSYLKRGQGTVQCPLKRGQEWFHLHKTLKTRISSPRNKPFLTIETVTWHVRTLASTALAASPLVPWTLRSCPHGLVYDCLCPAGSAICMMDFWNMHMHMSGARCPWHRACLKVSGYEVIGRARGDLGANFGANVRVKI